MKLTQNLEIEFPDFTPELAQECIDWGLGFELYIEQDYEDFYVLTMRCPLDFEIEDNTYDIIFDMVKNNEFWEAYWLNEEPLCISNDWKIMAKLAEEYVELMKMRFPQLDIKLTLEWVTYPL
jgi:hypothetical protein